MFFTSKKELYARSPSIIHRPQSPHYKHAQFPDFDRAMECYVPDNGMPPFQNENWYLAKNIYYTNHWLRKPSYYKNNFKYSYSIPKIIHHIWLGSPLPERFKPLIGTWKKHHPTWKHMLWTDKEVEKFGLINKKLFMKCNNYGLKSDIARYEILARFGGFYADIDLECLKPLDILHQTYHFYACLFPNQSILANGVIGAAPQHPIIEACVTGLRSLTHVDEHVPGEIQQRTGPGYFSSVVFAQVKKSTSSLHNCMILPASYFFAYPVNLRFAVWSDQEKFKKRLLYAVPEAFGLHYWANSWLERPALPELNIKNRTRSS